MVRSEVLALDVKHKPSKILVVLEDEGANSVEVQHFGLAVKHISHDCAITL